jgi:DNA-binding transcriptional LysR family regulator
MPRETMADLVAFLAVARERSFTRAAAHLGVSPSALSHTIRKLEERVGMRLLTRTTRSVSTTEAGERLLGAIGPHFDDVRRELEGLSELRDRPAGTIRITSADHPAETILWPALEKLLPQYPDIRVEVSVDDALRDIAEERFDAGVRLGEQVAKDMIAVPISPDAQLVVVGAPSYFKKHGRPRTPHDLAEHKCINLRLRTLGGIYAWEFEKGGRELKVRVDGQVTFNDPRLMIKAARAGLGLAYVFRDTIEAELAEGSLVLVLTDWTPPFAGYHLYYPSRRQQSPAFAVLLEALRYRG